ncbi:MAG: DUF285 domain-containing protein, partial [Caldilineales bacterium]|nr:DUF285 domain-containing protein [Caldilineales bacterium]
MIPTTGGGYNYNVDCDNDGANEATAQTGDTTCNYGAAGTYTIRIKDNTGAGTGFPRIYFNNGGDAQKLLTIEQWGTGKWTSMANAFNGCTNLAGQASDAPDLSNVTDMTSMFSRASAFNQGIGNWNTANVTDMRYIFSGASAFNQDIGNWNTANVTDMYAMFSYASAFNQDIGNWNTANVTDMAGMFYKANAFNQDIGNWNTANVTDMNSMFSDASAFNQNIGNWNVAKVGSMNDMLNGARLSTENYDALLNGWNAQTLQSGVSFHGGASTYCYGEAARANMINSDGWTITDGGKDCAALLAKDFVITVKTDNPGSSSATQFMIPTTGGGYNYNVDCNNDGANEATAQTGDYTCNYGAAGTYTIRIKDNTGAGTGFPRIYFNNSGDAQKLLTIEQWGTGKWTSMWRAFYGCTNLAGQASDAPDLSNVTDMASMFSDASAFNQNIGSWNTANVTDMNSLFSGAAAFNQDIGNWNTANVTNMAGMFARTNAFNQDFGNWNTANVTNMGRMFYNASAFNQNIGNWNTANVTDMGAMFNGASAFNQDISNWNT